MNRDFESEYKKLIADEAPDIWGSIEAKLDAQTTLRRKKQPRWQYFVLPAAALLCVAVILPVLLLSRRMGANHEQAADAVFTIATADEAADADYETEGVTSEQAGAYVETESAAGEEAKTVGAMALQNSAEAALEESGYSHGASAEPESVEAEEDAAIAEDIYVLHMAEDFSLKDIEDMLSDAGALKLLSYDGELKECRVYFEENISEEEKQEIFTGLLSTGYVLEITLEGEEDK